MISFKKIYQLSFYIVLFLTFFIGGCLQFFIGISNTILTLIIVFIMYATYGLYALIKNKIIFNKTILWAGAYLLIIVMSALYNQKDIVSTLIYFIFPLLPLSVFLFAYINYKEAYLSNKKIFKLFFLISVIQLPVILLQLNFYDELMFFNNSSQKIASFDFLFGTFFLKSDHSLGLLILLVITTILLKNKKEKLIRYPVIAIIYLTITIFLAESNISKLLLVILLSLSFIIPFYLKHRKKTLFKILAFFSFILIVSAVNYIKDQKFISDKIGGTFNRQYTIKTSERQYELGTAKRGQILIMATNKLETKWVGDGPYSYFNILTGEFSKTTHFTQLIWTYFDLGIMGLVVVLGFLITLLEYLDIKKGVPFFLLFSVMVFYAFYTTIFSDIAIMFSLILIFNKRNE